MDVSMFSTVYSVPENNNQYNKLLVFEATNQYKPETITCGGSNV